MEEAMRLNNINLSKIDQYILKPTYLQIAIDGKWDKAWKIKFNNDKPAYTDITSFTSKGGERLVFELFFETTWGGYFLFGSYFSSILKTKSWDEFLTTVINGAFGSTVTPSKTIENIGNDMISEPKMFSSPCNSVVLGVLDFWRFYEPCTLLGKENTNSSLDLNTTLNKYPHLIQNKDNPQLLEFLCNYDPLHFIGFTVGTKENHQYILDMQLTNMLIGDILA